MEYKVVRFCNGTQMSASWFISAKGAARVFASARRAIKAGEVIMYDGLELQNGNGKILLKFQK